MAAFRIRVSKPAAITQPTRPQTRLSVLILSERSLRRGASVELAAGLDTMNTSYIGHRHTWGDPHLFGILPDDQRYHTYVIGKTGSGKTTLLRNLIIQRIAEGAGVAVIDPHGDLSEEILDHIPPSRADDLVYFAPADADFPIGFNPLAGVSADQRHLVVSGIVGAFKSIWRESWGPRLEYILGNCIAALLECENASLLGINRMLIDADYRRWVVRQVKDPFIRSFWIDEFENYDARFQREAVAPIQNKIGQILMSPLLRNILGQVGTKVRLPFMMNTGRLFIANLSKGQLGADKAALLGSLLTTQFQVAAMARASVSENDRRDFFLFIDEFHNFTTDAFATILAEARKYRLNLTLSHQYVQQLSEPVRHAIFGNVGTIISFRVGHEDADHLSREFGEEFVPNQFTDLDRYQILIKPTVDGQTQQPFRAETLPPVENWHGCKMKLIARSREKYSRPRSLIETQLTQWMVRP